MGEARVRVVIFIIELPLHSQSLLQDESFGMNPTRGEKTGWIASIVPIESGLLAMTVRALSFPFLIIVDELVSGIRNLFLSLIQ